MDNNLEKRRLLVVSGAIGCYLLLSIATLVVLGVLTGVRSPAATTEAWVHAVIVAIFAVVLGLRLRAARRGSRPALRAVGIIGAVLLVANVVEAAIGVFPGWMRIEMIAVMALMMIVVIGTVRARRAEHG